jgi:hypothetical protein
MRLTTAHEVFRETRYFVGTGCSIQRDEGE